MSKSIRWAKIVKLAMSSTAVLTLGACAKKEFGPEYNELVKSSQTELQNSKSSEEWEASNHSLDKTYLLLKQKASLQQKDICLYFKSMSVDDIYFVYPEVEKDVELECHDELVNYVKGLVQSQMGKSLDPNFEIQPVPGTNDNKTAGAHLVPTQPAPSVPVPEVTIAKPAPQAPVPTVEIVLPTPSTTPSPSHTSTPRPSATPHPSPTATPRPSATALPTPLPTPLATPQPNPLATAVPNSNKFPLGIDARTGAQLVKVLQPMGKPHLFGGLKAKEIALTFDDGPHGHLSQLLMNSLRDQGVSATFFLVGQNTLAHKNLVKAEWAAGHFVGGHSVTHANLATLSYTNATNEIRTSMNDIVTALGFTPNLFRFPYGSRTSALSAYLAQNNIAEVAWNMDSLDWKYRNAQVLYKYAIQQIINAKGGIILFHDIQPHTIAMMPTLLQWLRNNGYKTYLLKGNALLKPSGAVPKP